MGNHLSRQIVTNLLKRPTRTLMRVTPKGSYLALLQVGFTLPFRITTKAVRSYRTISPLPTNVGGLFSAALSVGSRPPGVTWHFTLWSPDFPLKVITSSDCLADLYIIILALTIKCKLKSSPI